MSSFSAFSTTQSIPPTISLDERSIPAITSSLTPFAFAPGVLNTAIPSSVHLSTGILFTPAPALAIAIRLSEKSISCIFALLTRIPEASSILSVLAKLSSNLEIPKEAILFNVAYLCISSPSTDK